MRSGTLYSASYLFASVDFISRISAIEIYIAVFRLKKGCLFFPGLALRKPFFFPCWEPARGDAFILKGGIVDSQNGSSSRS